MAAVETQPHKPRPPSQPHPLRVTNFERTLGRTVANGSPRSASPSKTARSAGAHTKETTVVGVGTHGLGHRAQELHDYFQRLVYKEWCDRKRVERAKARAEADSPQSPASPGGKDRVAVRRHQEAVRAMEAEMRTKALSDEFGGLKRALKEEHKKARAEENAFRHQFAADNVAQAREHLNSAREHRQQLEHFSLPELAPLRKECLEEKELWETIRQEQRDALSEEKRSRRQYVLDLKHIAQNGLADEHSARSAAVARQRQALGEKEARRRRERQELVAGLAETVRLRKDEQRTAAARARQEHRDRLEQYVEARQKEFRELDQPIAHAREEWLQQMKQVLKGRHEDEKGGASLTGRDAFIQQRRALASDLRVEAARLQSEVAKERAQTLLEKRAAHDEERRAVTARRERRGGSPSKPAAAEAPQKIASVTFA